MLIDIMKHNIVWCALALGCGLCGCSPEEMEIALPVKAIADVVAGCVSEADITVSFNNEQDSVRISCRRFEKLLGRILVNQESSRCAAIRLRRTSRFRL